MAENARNECQFEVTGLLLRYIAQNVRAQHVLLILAFLTFGIGDAVTAAIMMDSRGAIGESNVIAAYIYANHGLAGLLAAKIWFTIILIAGALMVYWRSEGRSYWMVNGFLAAITIGGTMATVANLQAAANLPFMSPGEILFIYIGSVLILVEAGDFVDGRRRDTSTPDVYPWRNTHIGMKSRH